MASADLEWILNQPVDVKSVRITGNTVTKTAFLERELRQVQAATTLGEATQQAVDVTQNLRALDLYDSISVSFDKLEGNPQDLEVVVDVLEKRQLSGTTSANRDLTGENELVLTGKVRNVFGGAETLSVSGGAGDRVSRAYNMTLTKPHLGKDNHSLEFGLHKFTAVPSYQQLSRGCSLTLKDFTGTHSLGASGSWRDVMIPPVNKNYEGASTSLVNACGPSVKTSLQYEFVHDTRNSTSMPTLGSLFTAKTELAGLLGDVEFASAEVLGTKAIPLPAALGGKRGATLELSINGGVIRPWSCLPGLSRLSRAEKSGHTGGVHNVLINDRFFCGGPLILRGFQSCGIGSRDGQDPLGGELFTVACAKVSWPLPNLLGLPTRFHAFANVGNVVSFNGESMSETVTRAKQSYRAAAGCGLVLGVPIGRLELNLVTPLRKLDQDVCPAKSFQFGLGIKFL